MSNKLIFKYKDVEDKIISAVDKITDPIRQTMGPAGGNVIYEDNMGNQHYTNDGVTIAKNIFVEDPVENTIIEIIKGSSLKTNMEAGDGTSSTILLSSILIKEGLKLVDRGYNQMEVRAEYDLFAKNMTAELNKMSIKIDGDGDLLNISRISSNNDMVIAKDVVETIKVVGEDGQVVINPGYGIDTEIVKDTGFIIKSGTLKELSNANGQVMYKDVPVFITDKRLYYHQEAETILSTVIDAGYSDVVIIASDFIGEALPYFVANHQKGNVNVLLIKESNVDILSDVATYLGGQVVSDKNGMIVNNIGIGNFTLSSSIFSDQFKTIISKYSNEKNKQLDELIKHLRQELKRVGNKNDPEYRKIESRISSLTKGMVTIKVGGRTQMEIIERIYRYEDAINAARSSLSDGYLVGGGLGMFHALKNIKVKNEDFKKVFKRVCEANIRQVSENAGNNPDLCIKEISELSVEFGREWGFDASSGTYMNLLDAGVIEPLRVVRQVINNAISIANVIITSRYLIVNQSENYGESKKDVK